MSSFVPVKHNLKDDLLFYHFYLKKLAVESIHLLLEACELAPSISIREYWFRRFKRVALEIEDRERRINLKSLKTMNQQHYSMKIHVKRSKNWHTP
ncbi:hypothetical protein NPIL_227311 [Nephila pilipes]|uniref:Mos1 transposase HTH domain-containing protein n=1 Tax=Nephila pilipes TaxID=299642 RepID=A0A8X6IR75_NEPPI|nr:hypothetical protein NPIL_227311 [Nephila pilipes]